MDFDKGLSGPQPPTGPDVTFLCLRIENRSVLQDILNPNEYVKIQQIFKEILTISLERNTGHCAEHLDGHIFDALCVFSDVYHALRCAIHIQSELHHFQWPSFYYDAERDAQRMTYVGSGDEGICYTVYDTRYTVYGFNPFDLFISFFPMKFDILLRKSKGKMPLRM